ncbi:MAG: FAD binding domain-containing protein [Pseudomonadota bacterium]|nr:FAD binding domain-containing protein [Pseudomonadota bacterium]
MGETVYVRAVSVHEAVQELANARGDGLVIAGGTVVCTLFNQHLATPKVLVDISRIMNLREINMSNDGRLLIGALVTHDDILRSPVIGSRAPLLTEIAEGTSCARLRNRGTIGGNLCTIGSQGDAATGLIALGAILHLRGPGGARTVSLEEFYADAFMVDLGSDEIMEKIELPGLMETTRYGFCKLGPRQAMDWTQITVSVVFNSVENLIKDIRIGMNGVSNAPIRPLLVEHVLEGQEVDKIDWVNVIRTLDGEISPDGDLVYSAHFKRRLAGVALRRAMERATLLNSTKGIGDVG